MGNGFVGCCGRRRCHPGQFFSGQLRAVGAQCHGWSRGRYGVDNCLDWAVLLDTGCLLHRVSSENRNREDHETNWPVTSLLLKLISSTYGSELVAELFGCGRQTSDAELAIAVFVCGRTFVHVRLAPSQQPVD